MTENNSEITDVLCVISRLRSGGVQTFLINNVGPLLRHGIRLNFAVDTTEPQRYDDYVRSLGCRLYPITGVATSKRGFMSDLRALVKAHPEFKVVHCHLNFTNIFAQIAVAGLGRKVITHAHSSYSPSGIVSLIGRGISRLITPITADGYWACSADSLKWLVGERLAKSQKAAVITNAIDTDRWKFNGSRRAAIRQQLNIAESTYVWAHTGSFSPVKNHRFLLDLFSEYRKTNPDSHLILCGDGALRNDITQQINDLGIADYVTMTGVVDNAQDYLSAADAFIFPSIFEGFSLSLIEAGCNGLATTTTTTAVPKDAQLEGVTAISGFDTAEWIDAIEQARKSPKPDRSTGAQNAIDAGFEINSAAALLAKHYKDLTNRSRDNG